MKKFFSVVLCVVLSFSAIFCLVSCNTGGNEYDKDGNMILNLRNLYFSDWTGGDAYTSYIENKFGVSVRPTSYSWSDWDGQVRNSVQADQLPDVFHFNLTNYNYSGSYEYWAVGGSVKPLPTDMSRWQNLQKMLNGISNLDELKTDGKLYCIPIAKNIEQTATDYSPFTYVYRRDWAKDLGVYRENDEYTYEQFVALLNAFYTAKGTSGDIAALADVEWGFPSVINFFKTAPHCFATDETGKVVCNYLTEEYLKGLELAKQWSSVSAQRLYGYDQAAGINRDGDVAKQYYAGRVGVFYENLSLANYSTLRQKMSERSEITTQEQLDDATAIMKVSGPDGKYALEGGENWYSATFFSADISDEKQEKILDIMDWLLSEEGTMMAAYGFEGYDYEKDADGNVILLEAGWEKDMDGKYVEKFNGAKYLRYMTTLGYDMSSYDPLTDKDALKILNDWNAFMETQRQNGKLRILEEDAAVKWLSTPKKNDNAGDLLQKATSMVVEYVYGTKDMQAYRAMFTNKTWQDVLNEINEAIGK